MQKGFTEFTQNFLDHRNPSPENWVGHTHVKLTAI